MTKYFFVCKVETKNEIESDELKRAIDARSAARGFKTRNAYLLALLHADAKTKGDKITRPRAKKERK